MKYDAIVVGAGNGGLVAALTMQKEGKKVLLLDSHNLPGGVATTFVRGRFEFEASLHELCQYGDRNNHGNLYDLFNKLGIASKIEMIPIKESFHVITLDNNKEYTMPVGVEEFINKMEEYVPKSRPSMEKFFQLCEEIVSALKYLNDAKGHVDAAIMKEKYSNFMVVAAYPVKKVLDSIHMPRKAQEIISTYWTYLGSPIEELSFVHYASMLYSYIINKPVIPKCKSHELSLVLLEEFESLGGVSKFLTPVKEIIVESGICKGVVTNDGKIYKSRVVISNVSPNVVYGKLIKQEEVPAKARQLTNARILGARGVCVYLGLNKSPEELGLNNYSYFIYHTLNSKKEFERMKHLKGDNLVGIVINNAYDMASPKGTTMLCLTSLLFSDVFDNVVTKENYFELKNAFADNLIEIFEAGTGINIRDYIEEIEIATPVTFARYTGHPDGVIYGYLTRACDNILPRIMNMNNENYIKNLYFAGGFGSRASGFSSSYMSGYTAGLQGIKSLESGANNES